MIEALLGSVGGGLLRLAPEALKFFDRKNERKHELSLGQQQYDVLKLQGQTRLDTVQVEQQGAQLVAGLEAIKSAYENQKTGVKWVDAFSATVRPVVTYGFAAGYLYIKMTTGTWTEVDTTIFAGILNFWFVGRVFEKK